MSGGWSSSLTFPSSSSSTCSAPSRRRSHLSFGTIIASYRIGGHVLQHLNLAVSLNRNQRARDTRVRSSILPPPLPPLPSDPPSGHCRKAWVVGTVIAMVLSFVKSKWGPLLKLKDELETVVQTADRVAEVVEKVAEQVEKAADAVADHTPPNSKLHVAAAYVEKVAKEVSKDAHLADVTLDKVEEVEKEVEKDVESLIEPIIGGATRITKHPDA